MDIQLLIICLLTFVIHLIDTLAYSVRITAVRTRKIALSFALFNILVLIARTSNTFQGPFLAKRIEENLANTIMRSLAFDFHCLLLSASLATLCGAFLIPSFQRLFGRAVFHFQVHRSVPRLFWHVIFRGGLVRIKDEVSLPSLSSVTQLPLRGLPFAVVLLNAAAVSLWTVGVFASLYAGSLNPELRVTAITLSSVVNGGATVLMFLFIDPHLSMMTDDVMDGRTSEASFRHAIVWLVGSRFAGTLLAQLLLVPAATLILFVAKSL